jgi:hypothetical protein
VLSSPRLINLRRSSQSRPGSIYSAPEVAVPVESEASYFQLEFFQVIVDFLERVDGRRCVTVPVDGEPVVSHHQVLDLNLLRFEMRCPY